MIERRKIVFHGRVQGVGFRYRAQQYAKKLELTGWGKNEYDGTVSAEIQGEALLIDKMLKNINGDHYIVIEWIDSRLIPLKEEKNFKVLY